MPAKIRSRFRSLFIEAIALLILVPLSIFLFTKLSGQQQKEAGKPIQSSSPTTENIQIAEPTTNASAVPSQQPTSSVITLKISSPNKSSSYKIPTNKSLSVIDIMKIAEGQGMIMKTKDYGAPLGLLIESINNIPNDSKKQKYWTLYVDDKISATGASSTMVNPGETVTWKFENTTL